MDFKGCNEREALEDLWIGLILVMIQVQAGGSFDVDYEVVGPGEKVILDGQKERQGDFVFTASDPGEYKFCFNNQMSTFAEKFVDFEIAVCLPTLPFPNVPTIS